MADDCSSAIVAGGASFGGRLTRGVLARHIGVILTSFAEN